MTSSIYLKTVQDIFQQLPCFIWQCSLTKRCIGPKLVGRFHSDVCRMVKTVNHLSSFLLQMMFCLEVKPIEPCQTGWILTNSQSVETKTTGHPSSAATTTSVLAGSPSSVYLTMTLFPENHANYSFYPHFPLKSILRLFSPQHKSFCATEHGRNILFEPIKMHALFTSSQKQKQ